MPVSIVRLNRLYNIPAVKARPASKRQKARKARPARRGMLDIGKSSFYENIVLKNPDDPFIPGTPVRRLPVIPLGPKAVGAAEEQVERVSEELRRWREEQLLVSANSERDTKLALPIE
jgi:hypothetical protein